ncbi:MAG: methylmalonyl-CoA epimerase [Candidatus Poseidoniales archaeon]|nr:MAG: methylmalonyl-CoA epimerase [Candidatus Poseidoniales archaeon]
MDEVKIDHIGIATKSIQDSSLIWEILGFTNSGEEIVADQGVKVKIFSADEGTKIELLEPLGEETPIGKFIKKRGPGIQQLAISVSDIKKTILKLKKKNINLINEVPTKGANGNLIAFIHPSSAGGILIELVEENQ